MVKATKPKEICTLTVRFFSDGQQKISDIKVEIKGFEKISPGDLQDSYRFQQEAWGLEQQKAWHKDNQEQRQRRREAEENAVESPKAKVEIGLEEAISAITEGAV